jgi:2-polyprenyl-3-methyl-5-hydroxy-6-metoxy-1,4-benzoquinol methylase
MASFFNAENGMDNILVPLKEKVSEGYSILIFPEAHCFFDNRIHRFHKGAFYLAEMLQIDILPVVVFGSGESLGKGEFWGRPAGLRMKILKRIGINDASFGQNYSERSKQIRHLYIRDYESLMEKEGNGHYYRKKLVLNYVFKGPVLEWSLRVKMNRENYYQQYNELLPRKGGILELGCGYGFMSYMLSFTGPDRQITGVDYDEEKIRVAQNCFSKNENIIFLWKDIMKYDFENQDTIVLNDALYDLPQESQAELLNRCIEKLNPRGMILLKDSDSLTSMSAITQMFNSKELEVNMIRKTKHTSCLLMIIRKK